MSNDNPTNEQELDPIINIMDMWDFSPLQDEDIRRARVYKEIQAHTNAEIARVLDRLAEQSRLQDYTHGTTDSGRVRRIVEAIEAERAKLKEVK
jgi:hypothetical protein